MNIYDVSKQAQVSIATVSRVMNSSPNVSEKTRTKVLAVMKELGYTPNVFARGLGLNTMNTIGIMCADSSDPYLAGAVYYLEQELRNYGYDSILCCTGYETEMKKKYLKLLLSKRVDAIILTGSHYVESKAKDNLYLQEAAKKLPIMLLNGHLEGSQIYSTLCDDKAAIHHAASRLIQSGRTSILYLYAGNSDSNKKKLDGYKQACEDYHIPLKKELMLLCTKDLIQTRDLLLHLNEKGVFFDAVLAAEDILAVAAVKYACAARLKIPEDLSIIGYNNSTLSMCTNPEITSVDNKVESLCAVTASTLIKVLNGKNVPFKTLITTDLVIRGTTDFN